MENESKSSKLIIHNNPDKREREKGIKSKKKKKGGGEIDRTTRTDRNGTFAWIASQVSLSLSSVDKLIRMTESALNV